MASQIEELVLGELAKQSELQAIDRGFVWQRGADVSQLTFEPTTVEPGDFGLCATARIETIFGDRGPVPGPEAIAKLNRRACYGAYFVENGKLGIRASYCIYDKEPASRWVAIALLRAMGEQLALGFGIVHSEFVPESLPANRSNLEYPRTWSEPPDPAVFERMATEFTNRGLISTRGRHGLVLEVPLSGDKPSRMLDPRAETALLHVSTDVPHPLAGVGYFASIAIPFDPPPGTTPAWCQYLNEVERTMQDFVPRLGAWGMRSLDGELVYSMFWPTNRAEGALAGTIMNWMVQRTLWLRERFWVPGQGVSMRQATNG